MGAAVAKKSKSAFLAELKGVAAANSGDPKKAGQGLYEDVCPEIEVRTLRLVSFFPS